MWYSGIDQHKRDSVLTTYGPDGARVKQARVTNTPLAMAQYFAEFPGLQKAVVESTGGWYWLADTLATLGVELVLAQATRLKAIAAAKVKTDQVDSDILALLLRADLIPVAHMIPREQRGARDLMRTRLRLVEKCVSAPKQHRPAAGEVQRHQRRRPRRPLPAPRELPCRSDPAAHRADRDARAGPVPPPDPQPRCPIYSALLRAVVRRRAFVPCKRLLCCPAPACSWRTCFAK